MKQKSFCLLSLYCCLSVQAAGPTTWTARGIGAGGGMFSPSISPHDGNKVFLAVDMGQVMKTSDGGVSWSTVPFRQLQAKQTTEVQFTSDPLVLYAADQRRNPSEGTLARPMKSEDGGSTWHDFPAWTASWRCVSVHASPLRPDTFLACSGDRLRHYCDGSTDGTFSIAHTFAGQQGRVAGAFWYTGAQEECWVATNQGMLYSANGGASFTPALSPPTANPICSFAGARDPATGQIRFIAITTTAPVNALSTPQSVANGTNTVWSLDWGAPAWINVSGGLPGTERPTIVAMARSRPDLAHVATNRPSGYPYGCSVWRLDTIAGSWQNILTTPGNANVQTGWLGLTQRTGLPARTFESDLAYAAPCGLAVHPADPSRVILSDNAQIILSDNADSPAPSWTQLYTAADNPGHSPGELIPNGQSYLGNGLEVTVCTQLDFCGGGFMQAAMLDVQMMQSQDGGKRWGWPFDHTTLGGGDVNSVAHDPATGVRFAATAFTNSAYEFLGCDDAHTDNTGSLSKGAAGVYYQAPGEGVWHPLRTDFGVPAGQRGANPVWLTLDAATRVLYVSVVSSDPAKDGIYPYDLELGVWRNRLTPPLRGGVQVQHPFTLVPLPDGGLVASYCAHQVGDASIFPATLANGAYKPTSGIFYLPPGATAWIDRTKNEMRYFTRDVVVDPHDPTGLTWLACVWNTDSNTVTPPNPLDTPGSWGGLYRTTNGGEEWVLIWEGDSVHGGSATSCAFHPYRPGELHLTTRFEGLWTTSSVNAPNPVFEQVESYPFRAPERVYHDPANPDRLWVTSYGNGIAEGLLPHSYTEWRTQEFGAQAGDDATAGGSADPDADGLSNALEYAFGTDPEVPGTAFRPQPLHTIGQTGLAYFRPFDGASHGVPGVTYTVQTSIDLQPGGGGWTTAIPGMDYTELTSTTGVPSGYEMVIVSLTMPFGPAGKRFIRLGITF